MEINCGNSGCDNVITFSLGQLHREGNGSSGSHTSSFTYSGKITCSRCNYENEVEYLTDEVDDTNEILSVRRIK